MDLSSVNGWYQTHTVSIYSTIAILFVNLLVLRYARPRIEESVEHGRFKDESLKTASTSVQVFVCTISAFLILIVWGFDFKGFLLVSTGVLTLTGVALFANWSILSNITAFFILLLFRSFRRGNFIRVIDLDNYIEGYITDINLFHTTLLTEEREHVIYPNNLLLSRPSIINPRVRFSVIGKTFDARENRALQKSEVDPET